MVFWGVGGVGGFLFYGGGFFVVTLGIFLDFFFSSYEEWFCLSTYLPTSHNTLPYTIYLTKSIIPLSSPSPVPYPLSPTPSLSPSSISSLIHKYTLKIEKREGRCESEYKAIFKKKQYTREKLFA